MMAYGMVYGIFPSLLMWAVIGLTIWWLATR
jgi:hypothetical protein